MIECCAAPVFWDHGGWLIALISIAVAEVAFSNLRSKRRYDPRYPMSTNPFIAWLMLVTYPFAGMVVLAIRIFYWRR